MEKDTLENIKKQDAQMKKMTLDEVLQLDKYKKIDFLLQDHIPESVIDYYSQAVILRDTKRRQILTDDILKDKLEIILKSIDKSLLTRAEIKSYDKILSKYMVASKSKMN